MWISRIRELEIYVAQNGKKPFVEWIESLQDTVGKHRIKERLDRLALGNVGDYKALGSGVFELRCNFGPGYRIYFGEDGKKWVLLLCGGDKKTQGRDIRRAISYWKDYLSR